MWTVVLAAVAGLAIPSTVAHASCAARPGPSGQPVVFVGVAVEERRGYTRFEVEGVRAGPDVASEVWVRSGQDQPPWPLSLLFSVGSSRDAEFVEGRAYVVGAQRSFATGSCTISEAAERERDLRPPTAGGSPGADPPIGPLGQTLWTAGVVVVLIAAAVVLRRRSRNCALLRFQER